VMECSGSTGTPASFKAMILERHSTYAKPSAGCTKSAKRFNVTYPLNSWDDGIVPFCVEKPFSLQLDEMDR